MKNTKETIIGVLGLLVSIDFIGFALWTLSGQTPIDNFYIGAITANIIKLIF